MLLFLPPEFRPTRKSDFKAITALRCKDITKFLYVKEFTEKMSIAKDIKQGRVATNFFSNLNSATL